jgi:3alpha(or 20beta)-hydroxysteroid dehydrogenase
MPLLETDTALFERHMRVNQLGCFLGMKAVAGFMERSRGGCARVRRMADVEWQH